MGMTVWDLVIEMNEIDSKINKLQDDLKKAAGEYDRNRISKEIDGLYSEFLMKKHQLDRIELQEEYIWGDVY